MGAPRREPADPKSSAYPVRGDHITVDETDLQLLNAGLEPSDRGWYLFEPASRTIAGGVLVFSGLHVWTADSPTVESRTRWVSALNQLEELSPTLVIAGHRAAGSADDVTGPAPHPRLPPPI